MSMTVVNARRYVSRIIGGEASQEALDMADEAILRGYQDMQAKKFWRFLLKDTTLATSVASCNCSSGSATVSAPSTGAFDFVNVGQTVTVGAGDTVTLAADTTVSAVTRNSDGTVASITLSNAFGGTNDTSTTLTFSANIPIRQGSNDYALPTDFYAPFTAQFQTVPRNLIWRDQRYWDRVQVNQSIEGTPSEYTTYNPYSDLTQNFGTTRLKFDVIPSSADTLLLRYYRRFNTTGTNIDMPDDLLYQFLDYCRSLLLTTKKAQDDPAGFAAHAGGAVQGAAESDDEPTDDNDTDLYMKSQYEMGNGNQPLWRNGQFDPY